MTSEYSICRTCGTRAPIENMESIYNCQEVASKFKKLLPLNIVLDRRLSEFMCKPCIMELNLTHEFIEKALVMQKQQLDEIFSINKANTESAPALTPEKTMEVTQEKPAEGTESAVGTNQINNMPEKIISNVPEKIISNEPEKSVEIAKPMEKRAPSPELILLEDEDEPVPLAPPIPPPHPQIKLKPISSLMNPSAAAMPTHFSIPTQQVRPTIQSMPRTHTCDRCFTIFQEEHFEAHKRICYLRSQQQNLINLLRVPSTPVKPHVAASLNKMETARNTIPEIRSLQRVVSSINPPSYSNAVANRPIQSAPMMSQPVLYPNTMSSSATSNLTQHLPQFNFPHRSFSQVIQQPNSNGGLSVVQQQPYIPNRLTNPPLVMQQVAPTPAPQMQVVNPVTNTPPSEQPKVPDACTNKDSNNLEILDFIETPRVLSTFSLAGQAADNQAESSNDAETSTQKLTDASSSLNVKALMALWSNPDLNTSSIFEDKQKCAMLFKECLNSMCQCSNCRIFFLNSAEYNLHLTSDVHGKRFHKFFPCYACKINFANLQLLKEHHAMGLHGNAKWQYSCSLCPLFSSKEENVLKHMVKSHCFCPHCHSYLQKLRYELLSKKSRQLEAHKCLVCGLLINRYAAMAMRKCIETDPTKMVYVCNFCSISVGSKELLTQHFTQYHILMLGGKAIEPFESPKFVPHFLPYREEGTPSNVPSSTPNSEEKEGAPSNAPTNSEEKEGAPSNAPTSEKDPCTELAPAEIDSDTRSQRDSCESEKSNESVPSIKVEKEDAPANEKSSSSGAIQYCCHECPASFSLFSELIFHAKHSHTKDHLRCSNCNRNFASRDGLDSHKCRDTSAKMVLELIKVEDMQN